MSDRFYKIRNTWYPWQTAHGLYGYTKTPTIRITYISTSQATWGQPESGYGFFDGNASEPQDGSYFHTSTWGWFDADTMAKTIWLMPSECEIEDIFFENDGEISPGARLIIDPSVSIDEEDWRYLIASVRNLGWHTLDEWAELGWVLSDPNTLYFGGDFSGNNIRMESVDGGGGLIDKFASYKTLFELRGWEPGGLFIDKPRMMGICGVLTETSDSVVLVEVLKQLSVGRIEFTGSLAEGDIPESGVVEEYVPAPADYFEIDLGLRWDVNASGWLSKTFSNNDWWWAGILSNEDLVALRAFGGDIIEAGPSDGKFAGLIGALAYDEAFDYELIDMFSSIGTGSVTFDKTNFNLVKNTSQSRYYSNSLLIASIYVFSTACKTYRVRITRKPAPALPSVTTINVSLSALGQSKSLGSDETSALYNSSTGYSQVLYDTSKVYATVHMSANGVDWYSGFPLENEYGLVAVRNKTGSTMTISGGIIAQCDDVTASVVTVFNSSDEAFNAFKFTVNNTDYYYVLDNTQTDWTDDLSSIGYSLDKVITGYFTSSGSSATSDSWVYSGNAIFDAAGQLVYYDSTKSYTIKKIYNYSGSDYTSAIVDQYNGALVNSSSGVLNLSFSAGGNAFVLYKIQYTES